MRSLSNFFSMTGNKTIFQLIWDNKELFPVVDDTPLDFETVERLTYYKSKTTHKPVFTPIRYCLVTVLKWEESTQYFKSIEQMLEHLMTAENYKFGLAHSIVKVNGTMYKTTIDSLL